METLLAWLLMFAAAAMIVLGILLLAAERELRKQRRELEKLRRNHRIRAIIGQLYVGPPRLKAPKRNHRRN